LIVNESNREESRDKVWLGRWGIKLKGNYRETRNMVKKAKETETKE